MTPKMLIAVCLVLLTTACNGDNPPATDTTEPIESSPLPAASQSPAEGGIEPVETAEPPMSNESVITDARLVGDPVYFPSMGDLWMPTWTDDGRLFLSWGDGTGFGDGYPTTYPAYDTGQPVTVPDCGEEYFPCRLWCNVFQCSPGQSQPPQPLTDAGVLAFTGPVPEFTDVENVAVDVPQLQPFFIDGPDGGLDVSGQNDKPSSLLFVDGRLYFAGHSPAGQPVKGYVAYSDDYGRSWIEAPDSPWGESSNFRVLMFLNMGQNYNLNQDGFVYAFGIGAEAAWTNSLVYLARVPKESVADYSTYEYFTSMVAGEPGWSSDESQAVAVENLYTSSQASAMFHEGTGRYLFISTDTGLPEAPPISGALYEAPQPWGPWTQVTVLCFTPECNDGSYDPVWTDGKYIAGLIPKDAGPNYVYFTISGGDEHYQLQIGKLELITGP